MDPVRPGALSSLSIWPKFLVEISETFRVKWKDFFQPGRSFLFSSKLAISLDNQKPRVMAKEAN